MFRLSLLLLLASCVACAVLGQDEKPAKPVDKAKPKEAPPQDAKLPDYEKALPERRSLKETPWSEVFFINGTDVSITVGIRSGIYGRDVGVSPRGSAAVKLPNGAYSFYYLIPKEPKKEMPFREAFDSINSPDGVAQLLKIDRASRPGSKELPGGEPGTPDESTQKKVLTLYQGRGFTLKQDNYVATLSTTRGEALREIKQEEKKPPEPAK